MIGEKMERKKLLLLNPMEYEHDFDRQALKKLEGTPGLEKLARKLNKHGFERFERLKNTGSNIKVTPDCFPEIFQLLKEVCEILYFKNIPDLYIEWDDHPNAGTLGSENPLIILTHGAVDSLTPEELLYVIGHEVGHIKSGHQLYHSMARYVELTSAVISEGTLGVGLAVGMGMELPLLYWSRMSELTADRAGFLACQDIETVISTEMKLAGAPTKYYGKLDTKQFIKQSKEFKGFDFSSLDKIAKMILIIDKTHPWSVLRTSELLKWYESGAYQKIIDKHGKNTIEELKINCYKCGRELKGHETFCGVCGTKVWKR